MDVFAHGLWGRAIFGGNSKSSRKKLAGFLGMAPDLFAFGPAIIAGLFTGDYSSWAIWPLDGIPKSSISAWSFYGYHVTHSLVVWCALAAALWFWRKQFPWIFGASALHILCDIPLHTLNYFPTPYLWPLPTPLHNGIHWASSRFMLTNYAFLAATYLFLAFRKRRQSLRAHETAGQRLPHG